jgi:hypothetical protein
MERYWKLTEEATECRRRLWTCRETNYMMMMMMMVMMIELLRATCCTSIGVLSFYLPKESRQKGT